MAKILALNPGATSTKIAVFDGEKVLIKKTVEHQGPEMKDFGSIYEQVDYRTDLIMAALNEVEMKLGDLQAVVGRGGLLKPMNGGTYAVNQVMLDDLRLAERGEHASNLGGILAYNLASQVGIPAYIVDPVAVDELEPVARLTGTPELQRISMSHALNMKAVGRKVAAQMGQKYQDVRLIVVHLGTGISLSAQCGGRMIDICDGKDEGGFAPDRCGALPTTQLVKLCYSGKYTYDELRKKMFGEGGMEAYLGTKDLREVEARMAAGDEQAELVFQAMAYQVAKEIGALATVMMGRVDKIVLTGGMAHSQKLTEIISERVSFIAPIVLVPGEEELESLAAGALRVLSGEEPAQEYN